AGSGGASRTSRGSRRGRQSPTGQGQRLAAEPRALQPATLLNSFVRLARPGGASRWRPWWPSCMDNPGRSVMEVSTVCRNFIDGANRRNWRTAVLNLNGLNMYEMLRSLKALDTADVASLRTALTALGGAVNGPRIEYALSVAVTNTIPATAPGDLEATGQVADARSLRSRPRSILVEPIPKARLTGYNATVTSAGNATMQAHFGAPRTSYSQNCQPVTNTALARRMVTRNVGPFSVTGLDSAVASLTTIMMSIA